MQINRLGTVVIPRKDKNVEALDALVDDITMRLLEEGALFRVTENVRTLFIEIEHGQVATPKDVNTKLKIGETALRDFYLRYDAI